MRCNYHHSVRRVLIESSLDVLRVPGVNTIWDSIPMSCRNLLRDSLLNHLRASTGIIPGDSAPPTKEML